jgi:protein-disulfide isomerase
MACSAAVLAAAAFAVPAWTAAKKPMKPAAVPAAPLTDMALGNPKAPVKLVEYAAVSCPHCAHWAETNLPVIQAKYINTGKVRYVLRETPIHGEIDTLGYRVARCGGPSKYFTVVDTLFRSQPEYLFKDENNPAVVPWLINAGAKAGMSEGQVKTCVNDKAADMALEKHEVDESNAAHIDETPTFTVNGKKVEDPTLENVEKAINEAAN